MLNACLLTNLRRPSGHLSTIHICPVHDARGSCHEHSKSGQSVYPPTVKAADHIRALILSSESSVAQSARCAAFQHWSLPSAITLRVLVGRLVALYIATVTNRLLPYLGIAGCGLFHVDFARTHQIAVYSYQVLPCAFLWPLSIATLPTSMRLLLLMVLLFFPYCASSPLVRTCASHPAAARRLLKSSIVPHASLTVPLTLQHRMSREHVARE